MEENYKKPSKEELKEKLDELQYKVTQENATERPFDKMKKEGYEEYISLVDIDDNKQQ